MTSAWNVALSVCGSKCKFRLWGALHVLSTFIERNFLAQGEAHNLIINRTHDWSRPSVVALKECRGLGARSCVEARSCVNLENLCESFCKT